MNYGHGGYGGYGGYGAGGYGGGYAESMYGDDMYGGSFYGGGGYSGSPFGGGMYGGGGYSRRPGGFGGSLNNPSFGGGYNRQTRGFGGFSGPSLGGRRRVSSSPDSIRDSHRPRRRILDACPRRRRGNPFLHAHETHSRRDGLYDADDDDSVYGSERANRSDGTLSPGGFWDDDERGGRRVPLTANNLARVGRADFNLTRDRWEDMEGVPRLFAQGRDPYGEDTRGM
jgi:hypothetical protein